MTKKITAPETLRWLEHFGRMAAAAQEVHPADVLASAANLIAERDVLRSALEELLAVHELEDRWERTPMADPNWLPLVEQCKARRPGAWAAAREALQATGA